MHGLETGKAALFGNAQRLGHTPGLPVGDANITHHAGGDEIIQRAQGLVDRRHGIGAMNLVKVDMVGLQPLQAGLDTVHQMPARGAAIIRLVAHLAKGLGGNHHFVPPHPDITQRLAQQPFGIAKGIDIGCIDKIDPRRQRPPDKRIGRALIDIGDHAPSARAA